MEIEQHQWAQMIQWMAFQSHQCKRAEVDHGVSRLSRVLGLEMTSKEQMMWHHLGDVNSSPDVLGE